MSNTDKQNHEGNTIKLTQLKGDYLIISILSEEKLYLKGRECKKDQRNRMFRLVTSKGNRYCFCRASFRVSSQEANS